MATVALVGTTGLVGSHIRSVLQNLTSVNNIHAFARKDLPSNSKLKPIIASDSSSWPQQYPAGAQLFISSLGTTRGTAGGLDKQREIDYDLNLALAKEAKAVGTKAYVLISSAGSSSSSSFPYTKMKGELEEAVKALDFEHCVILRPGLIVGEREQMRVAEAVLRNVAKVAGAVSGSRLKDFWAQDADVIARAAVRAGLDCIEGKEKEKFRMLTQSDIVRLGRTEWKD